ncbi:histidine phosphatase family protein [Inquilinus limosus]|uniref:Phosphoglycerate mutase n=1 Tax=Inquilinus limosus MP06 TaxID=1398085 RepID=A0A0A0CWM7_9PROT|nr:histidine phosphatase family protein [Inquilinus limosus]KGM30811.1 phosphoglycerate mutase [Inquilinus limosus MP06]
MTTFLLLRHAAHDNIGGFLAGRMSGVVLGEAGRAQADRLARRLRLERIDAVVASPRERAQQTAQAVAAACGLSMETAEELDEIDFGRWSGQGFEALQQDPLWQRWNAMRSLIRTPGGETMLDVQRRVLGLMERLAGQHGDRCIAVVSHADVIKAAVLHHLGLATDAWPRFDIAPASITRLAVGDWGSHLLGLNETVD